MKNIFITGADGFIGSHLTELLTKKGYNITALSYYNSFQTNGWLDYIDKYVLKNINIINGDIRDENFIYYNTKNIDTIFNLAALIGIPYSYTAMNSYVSTNINGTQNLLNIFFKNKKLQKIILTSTSEVYGSALYTPINENHPLQPQSPYSASKISSDNLGLSYFNSFGFPITIVRPFNTFGPRQSARAVIPTIINQFTNSNIIKLGNVDTIREFNYVNDVVEAMFQISKSKKTIGNVTNICSGQGIKIRELVDIISKLMNKKYTIQSDKKRIRPRKSEVNKLIGCNKKFNSLFKNKRKYDLKKGLKETIDWFLNENKFLKYDSNKYYI